MWSTGDWKELWRRRREHPGSAGYLGFDRGGGVLALSPDPRTVELIEPTSGVVLARVRGPHSETIERVHFDGVGVLWVKRSSHVERWDLPLIREQLVDLGIDWIPSSHATGAKLGSATVRVEGVTARDRDPRAPAAISLEALRDAHKAFVRRSSAVTPIEEGE